jgi:hypothetical protein
MKFFDLFLKNIDVFLERKLTFFGHFPRFQLSLGISGKTESFFGTHPTLPCFLTIFKVVQRKQIS